MNRKHTRFGLALLAPAILLAGCIGPAPLHLGPTGTADDAEPGADGKVNRIVQRILCELRSAKEEATGLSDYVMVAQLTVRVEDTGGLTPSLSVITPLSVASTSRTAALGGEVTRSRLRSFTHNLTIDIESLDRPCFERPGNSLTGDLGLLEIIRAGLSASRQIGVNPGTAKDNSHFGSSVQFTSKVGLNGGPSVVRTKFRGYGGGSGLANISRTGTDLLTVAFAPKNKSVVAVRLVDPLMTPADKKRIEQEASEEAEAAARALLNRILLENLNLFQ